MAKTYNSGWQPFEKKFDERERSTTFPGYIFPFSLVHNPRTNQTRCVEDLREHWKSQATSTDPAKFASTVIKDLNKCAPTYLALRTGKEGNFPVELGQQLLVLHRLRMPQSMYSYVMKLVLENDSKKSISSASVVSCLKLLETYVVRRMFHGIESGGLLAVARGLWNNTGGDPDKMLDVLDSTPTQEFPEDDVFDKDIRSAHLYEKSDAFVTFIVDEYERGIESSEGYVERDDFTVDHIMPQTLSDDWDIAPSVHEKWLHTWSNLTPLSGGPNSKKSNRSWESPITMLKTEQSFKTTLRIANDNDRWDKDSLERRANHLVDWGLKRWPKSV